MRTFEQTHPWLKFQISLRGLEPQFWLDLGEAVSKCEHLARVPLWPETATKLHQFYLAKGAAATTAIEGNTLSEDEVLLAVEGRLRVPPSKEYLKQEVDNVIAAFTRINDHIAARSLPPLTPGLIRDYNAQVLKNLPPADNVTPGAYRLHSVLVGHVYRGAPAEDCPYLIDRLCDWLNGPDFTAPPGKDLVYAIIKAILAHVYLAWIHPFGDGNGRTARLIEFFLLMSAGMPSPAAHLLSNHYNQTRAKYYRQLDHASRSGGDLAPFLTYAVRGLADELKAQLQFVWDQQWTLTWRHHVHELFQDQTSPSAIRQRHLALDLALHSGSEPTGGWVKISAIPELTPRLAKAYANKHPKTLQRDLTTLAEMKLILREPRRVRANRELIFAFLPVRKSQNDE